MFLIIIMKLKIKMVKRSHRFDIIDASLDMDTNMVNIKNVSIS